MFLSYISSESSRNEMFDQTDEKYVRFWDHKWFSLFITLLSLSTKNKLTFPVRLRGQSPRWVPQIYLIIALRAINHWFIALRKISDHLMTLCILSRTRIRDRWWSHSRNPLVYIQICENCQVLLVYFRSSIMSMENCPLWNHRYLSCEFSWSTNPSWEFHIRSLFAFLSH